MSWKGKASAYTLNGKALYANRLCGRHKPALSPELAFPALLKACGSCASSVGEAPCTPVVSTPTLAQNLSPSFLSQMSQFCAPEPYQSMLQPLLSSQNYSLQPLSVSKSP